MPRALLLLLVGLTVSAAASASAGMGDAGSIPACGAPAVFLSPDKPLAAVADAIRQGGPLGILAVGSSTTVGQDGAGSHTSFPYQMAASLRAALPQVQIRLTVRGGRGLTTTQMLAEVEAALKDQTFALVLWQTATVEAIHGTKPEVMEQALQAGIDRIRAQHGDLILIDPQFSRFLMANADLLPYEAVLRRVAAAPDVVRFRRYDLMRAWVNDKRIDLERTRKTDLPNAVAALQRCLGEALARFVLGGAGAATN